MGSWFQPERTVVAVLATFVISSALLGCGSEEGSAPKDTRPPEVQSTPYTGRELYEGMFFGVGRGAKAFPEIWNNERVKAQLRDVPKKLDIEKVAHTVSMQISSQDPDFFQRFGAGIQSHDHVLIAEALTEARKNTEQAARALNEAKGQTNTIGVTEGNQDLFYTIFIAVDTALFIYRWGVAAVAVAFLEEGVPDDGLSADRWVDTLAHKDFTPAAF